MPRAKLDQSQVGHLSRKGSRKIEVGTHTIYANIEYLQILVYGTKVQGLIAAINCDNQADYDFALIDLVARLSEPVVAKYDASHDLGIGSILVGHTKSADPLNTTAVFYQVIDLLGSDCIQVREVAQEVIHRKNHSISIPLAHAFLGAPFEDQVWSNTIKSPDGVLLHLAEYTEHIVAGLKIKVYTPQSFAINMH